MPKEACTRRKKAGSASCAAASSSLQVQFLNATNIRRTNASKLTSSSAHLPLHRSSALRASASLASGHTLCISCTCVSPQHLERLCSHPGATEQQH